MVVPQENCNQSDVDWAAITSIEGIGFLIRGNKPMNFSAYPYDDAKITKAGHINELDKADFVTVNFDEAMAGLGTATCGPGVLSKYIVKPGNYNFKVSYRPVNFQQKSIFKFAAEKH